MDAADSIRDAERSLENSAADPAPDKADKIVVAATALGEQQDSVESDVLQETPIQETGRLDDYREAIARLEAEQGAWGHGLAEQLSGMGRSYQIRGNHRDAIEIFDRAIHVSRINNGLYDLGQVPIIESMLESLKARGRWDEVHERHQYLYWLHKRNFGAEDPRMLPVIERLGKWYINDYALNPNRRMMDQLVDAYNLFEHAVNIVSGTYGQLDLRLIEPLRGLVMSNWYFANHRSEGPSTALQRNVISGEIGRDSVAFPNDQQPKQLTQYLRNNYADGKRAIEQMVEIYDSSPDAPPGAAAQAKIELGDWEQLFDRPRTAGNLYREAYDELVENEATRSQAEKIFAQPVALPELDLVESDLEQPARVRGSSDGESAEPAYYVLVSFDVNRFGEAESIDILESRPEENAEQRTRVKRALRNTRFRPRLVDGEAVDTKGLTQKYVFTND